MASGDPLPQDLDPPVWEILPLDDGPIVWEVEDL